MPVYPHRGKWMYDFMIHRVRHWKAGFKIKEDAVIAEMIARKNLDQMNLDFTKLCESRLRELKSRRTVRWFRENELLIKRLTEIWGKKKEIYKADVDEFLNRTAATSKTNANSRLKMIKALFQHGIAEGIWDKDPTERIKKFPVGKKRKYIPPIEDVKAVLSLAKPMDRLYLLVLSHTMGRVNAVNQLRWTDVHKNHISLYTRKARNSDLKEIVIPMNAVLRETIRQIPMVSEYVFINPRTGRPYVYRKTFLSTLCKNAKVPRFTFHCIRHFTASLLDNKGVPLTDIQKLLGHERATTTDIYLQSLRGSTDEAVKHLEVISIEIPTTPARLPDNQEEN